MRNALVEVVRSNFAAPVVVLTAGLVSEEIALRLLLIDRVVGGTEMTPPPPLLPRWCVS